MPSVLKTGESQHDRVEVNKDRLVTKTKWVVESYHGSIKQWTLFNFKERLKSNHFIPVLGSPVRGTSLCLNAVRGAIYHPDPDKKARDLSMADTYHSCYIFMTTDTTVTGTGIRR